MIELAKNTLKQYGITYPGELKIYDNLYIKFKNKYNSMLLVPDLCILGGNMLPLGKDDNLRCFYYYRHLYKKIYS
jgi:hypothetical protein